MMISEYNVGYFVWIASSHVGSVFSAAVKRTPPKSGGCRIAAQNIPL